MHVKSVLLASRNCVSMCDIRLKPGFHSKAIACVSSSFHLRNARNASDCVWMETGLQQCTSMHLWWLCSVVCSESDLQLKRLAGSCPELFPLLRVAVVVDAGCWTDVIAISVDRQWRRVDCRCEMRHTGRCSRRHGACWTRQLTVTQQQWPASAATSLLSSLSDILSNGNL